MSVGVVVVTYNASDVIIDCRESLLSSYDADLRIVVVDNNSPDETVETIRTWATEGSGHSITNSPYYIYRPHEDICLTKTVPQAGATEIALLETGGNFGFAAGVNAGLKLLQADPAIDYFWILNPDCIAENTTASTLVNYAQNVGDFSVIGGRVFYKEPHLTIQSDGGRINFLTGICIPFNLYQTGRTTPAPNEAQLDYISGAHMFISRTFLNQAGLMPEDYFLYYEEIDWCCRRGNLPIRFCAEAAVHHDGGHSLGSATINKGPSSVSSYFTGRSRMKFVRRYKPLALPITFLYSAAQALRFFLKGNIPPGLALLRGICGLKPSRHIQALLQPDMSSDK